MANQAATPEPIKHTFGWVRDLPDRRDFQYAAVQRITAALPPAVDLRSGCSPVEDQGNLGSCTANAIAGALEFLELKGGLPLADLSRLFIYYNERVMEHTVQSDSGAQIRDGIKSVAKQGVCTELKWPYVISKFKLKPTAACYTEALKHTITQYQSLGSLADMQACLAEGFPFVFGFTVYESFESAQVAKTGTVPLPKKNERVLGGHAVLAVGYNDKQQRFIVRNSWGAGWGQKGYFTMPYAYLTNPQLASDFWVVRR
jgi:C1A family cysteine protease